MTIIEETTHYTIVEDCTVGWVKSFLHKRKDQGLLIVNKWLPHTHNNEVFRTRMAPFLCADVILVDKDLYDKEGLLHYSEREFIYDDTSDPLIKDVPAVDEAIMESAMKGIPIGKLDSTDLLRSTIPPYMYGAKKPSVSYAVSIDLPRMRISHEPREYLLRNIKGELVNRLADLIVNSLRIEATEEYERDSLRIVGYLEVISPEGDVGAVSISKALDDYMEKRGISYFER